MKLLLVEDDREAGAYLKRAIGEAGHAVDHAEAGREGLLLAAARHTTSSYSTGCFLRSTA